MPGEQHPAPSLLSVLGEQSPQLPHAGPGVRQVLWQEEDGSLTSKRRRTESKQSEGWA